MDSKKDNKYNYRTLISLELLERRWTKIGSSSSYDTLMKGLSQEPLMKNGKISCFFSKLKHLIVFIYSHLSASLALACSNQMATLELEFLCNSSFVNQSVLCCLCFVVCNSLEWMTGLSQQGTWILIIKVFIRFSNVFQTFVFIMVKYKYESPLFYFFILNSRKLLVK